MRRHTGPRRGDPLTKGRRAIAAPIVLTVVPSRVILALVFDFAHISTSFWPVLLLHSCGLRGFLMSDESGPPTPSSSTVHEVLLRNLSIPQQSLRTEVASIRTELAAVRAQLTLLAQLIADLVESLDRQNGAPSPGDPTRSSPGQE